MYIIELSEGIDWIVRSKRKYIYTFYDEHAPAVLSNSVVLITRSCNSRSLYCIYHVYGESQELRETRGLLDECVVY